MAEAASASPDVLALALWPFEPVFAFRCWTAKEPTIPAQEIPGVTPLLVELCMAFGYTLPWISFFEDPCRPVFVEIANVAIWNEGNADATPAKAVKKFPQEL